MACGVFENSVRRDKQGKIIKVVHDKQEIDLSLYDRDVTSYEETYLDRLQDLDNIKDWRVDNKEKSLGLWSRTLLKDNTLPYNAKSLEELKLITSLIKQGEIEIQCQ